MSALWKEVGVVALALVVTAAAIFQFGDRSVLVPPPEAVAAEFGTELTLGRIAPAQSYLSRSLRERVSTDSLRTLAAMLRERVGDIIDVEGQPGPAADDTAQPLIVLVGEQQDTLMLDVPLVWEEGTWKVAGVQFDWLSRPSGRRHL